MKTFKTNVELTLSIDGPQGTPNEIAQAIDKLLTSLDGGVTTEKFNIMVESISRDLLPEETYVPHTLKDDQ